MDDDDLLIFVAAGAVVAAAYWYMRQGPAIVNAYEDSISDSLGLGDVVTTIQNSLWTPPASAAPYMDAIKTAEMRNGLPTNLLARLLQQESSYKKDIINGTRRSSAGAIGIAQFMPATAKQFGIDPTNPWQSIDAAGKYLGQLYKQFGSWDKALAAYNWGQGNVSRKGLAVAPTETLNYFSQILSDIGLA